MSVVSLVRYDAACVALAAAKDVDEVKGILDAAVAMRAYARQAKNKELEADAWEIRVRAERRVGELLNEGRGDRAPEGRPKKNGSAPDPFSAPPTLVEIGIDKHLADRARKLTKADQEEFEQRLAEGRSRILDASERVRVDVLASGAHVGQNTGDNEWFTPTELIESARKVLGGIDLDPASSAEANKVVKAKDFYSLADDGLARTWTGRVWMNPPYAQPLINQFADKLVDAYQAKTVTSAIVLVNNATETAWFRALAEQASAACFPNGRIRFWHPNKPSATPLQGQALLYLGPSPVSFHARFSTVGIVWVKP